MKRPNPSLKRKSKVLRPLDSAQHKRRGCEKTSVANVGISNMKIRPHRTAYCARSLIAEGVEYCLGLPVFAYIGISLQPR